MQYVQVMVSDQDAWRVHRAMSSVYDWTEDDVKEFLEVNGYPTEGVDAGAVDGASLMALLFDPEAHQNFCEPVPDGMGFDPHRFETHFKPRMLEFLLG